MKFLYTINKALGIRTVVGSDEYKFKVYEHRDGRVSINVKYGDGGDIITTRVLDVDRSTRINVINAINATMVAALFKSGGVDLDEIMDTGIGKILGDEWEKFNTVGGTNAKVKMSEKKVEEKVPADNRYQKMVSLLDGIEKIVKLPGNEGASIRNASLFHGRLKPHLAINVTKTPYSADRIVELLNDLLIPSRGTNMMLDVCKSDEYVVVGRDKIADADCEKWRPMANFLNKWSGSLKYTPSFLYYERPLKIELKVPDSHEAFTELSTYTNMYAFKAFYTSTTLAIGDISLK